MEDTTTPYRTAKIVVVISAIAILFTMVIATSYIKVRQYRRRMDWEIPYKQVRMEEKIGEGQYGVVFRARYYGPVAVKRLDDSQAAVTEKKSFQNEIRLLKSLRHTNVLSLLGVVTKPHLAIITDWCYCSLFALIHEQRTTYPSSTIAHFCRQIADGMNYLHSKGVLHRDLKSCNILLAEANGTTLRICDFGLSVIKTGWWLRSNSLGMYGTVRWMAPEVLDVHRANGPSQYTVYSDVFAYGVCVYELLTSEVPYAEYEDLQVVYMVSRRMLELSADGITCDSCPVLPKIMMECLAFTPSERPTFDAICKKINVAEEQEPGIVDANLGRRFVDSNGLRYDALPQL